MADRSEVMWLRSLANLFYGIVMLNLLCPPIFLGWSLGGRLRGEVRRSVLMISK